MSQSEQHKQQQKIVQYLNEAHATEHALVRVLQSQIAMTPRGSYRAALETHLRETRNHAERVGSRSAELRQGGNPLMAVVGAAETVIGQALALGKTPLDLLRGSGGEEKVLKNAKDAAATEALEISHLHGDRAPGPRRRRRHDGDPRRVHPRRRGEDARARAGRDPKLADAVVGADVRGNGSYDVTKTGAADTTRAAGRKAKGAARKTSTATKRNARQARKVPGVARVEGQVKGAVASEGDLAIARYDTLTADEITGRLAELSQIDLAKVDAYERKNQNRTTIRTRITSLRGDEPWAGYDELTASEVQAVLSEGDDERAKQVRIYERAHKNRAGILTAAERELTERLIRAPRPRHRRPSTRPAFGVTEGDDPTARKDDLVFLFFSNRLGCFGSLVVSVVLTVVLLLILNVI